MPHTHARNSGAGEPEHERKVPNAKLTVHVYGDDGKIFLVQLLTQIFSLSPANFHRFLHKFFHV